MSGLLLTEPEYRAKVVHNACVGAGTNDSALIDVSVVMGVCDVFIM